MRTLFILLCLYGLLQNLNAQESKLKVKHVINTDKSVDFTFEKEDPGSFTLALNFKELNNASGSMDQIFSVKNYAGNFLTLTPVNKGQGVSHSYSYSYIRGKVNPKYDANFIYLLPYKNNTIVKVSESRFLSATYFGNTTPEDWKAYYFYTKEEDSVSSVRKGIVVDIKDLYETVDVNDVAYTSKENSLIVEHEDGTLANYKGFKKGSFSVKLGQTVYPGTFLGINTKSNSSGQYGISFMLTYLKSNDFGSRKNSTLQNAKSLYGFITPKFYVVENPNSVLEKNKQYTAGNTAEIIKIELSKKEIKSLKL